MIVICIKAGVWVEQTQVLNCLPMSTVVKPVPESTATPPYVEDAKLHGVVRGEAKCLGP
jgi:hypothetical protein